MEGIGYQKVTMEGSGNQISQPLYSAGTWEKEGAPQSIDIKATSSHLNTGRVFTRFTGRVNLQRLRFLSDCPLIRVYSISHVLPPIMAEMNTQEAGPILADDLMRDRARKFVEFLEDDVSRVGSTDAI
jgi:hypothetical protein